LNCIVQYIGTQWMSYRLMPTARA